MHGRRGFLKTTLGLATTAVPGFIPSPTHDKRPSVPRSTPEQVEYETILSQSPGLEWLGLPRDWSAVRHGLHPFSPERVVILTSEDSLKLGRTLAGAKNQIWSGMETGCLRRRERLMPSAKFDLLLAFVDHMAAYYHRPDLAECWAFRLASREQLGSCGLGRGFGLVHQFQGHDVVKTTSGKVDWWLFLLPEGANYESHDEKPVHVLIGHVFDQRRAGWEHSVWGLAEKLARRSFGQPDNADGTSLGLLKAASIDRVTAAQFLNHQLALCLRENHSR